MLNIERSERDPINRCFKIFILKSTKIIRNETRKISALPEEKNLQIPAT